MSADPLLRLEDVHAGYGQTQILQGVSLDVPEGSVVALTGRNGVGKTTTLRSIMGNVTPTAGTVEFDGTDITDDGPTDTAGQGISLVPEERRVFASLDVVEHLELGRLGGRDDVDKPSVEDLLNEFDNLDEHRSNSGTALSGGEQQMLAIARGLISGPDLLLLDEPTEGLAPLIVEQVADKIRDLNEQGKTILIVEQNIHVALDVADYCYVLEKGQIVYDGHPDDLREREDLLDKYLGVQMAD